MPIGAIVAIVLAALLLLVSGFVSASEIAFFSLSPADNEEISQSQDKTDEKIRHLLQDAQRTLATILITNNFVNVTIIMLCNYFIAEMVTFSSPVVEFIVVTVALTFLLLLFGEIAPKVLSNQNPLRFCRFACRGMLFFRKLFWPIETLLMSSGKLVTRVVQKDSVPLTVDDLEQSLDLTNNEEIKTDLGQG